MLIKCMVCFFPVIKSIIFGSELNFVIHLILVISISFTCINQITCNTEEINTYAMVISLIIVS